jgi:hypothetical protein
MVGEIKNTTEIINDLIRNLEQIPKGSDLSDVGNIIGIVIGENICEKMGYEKNDFMDGLRHGFSLSDGTH